MTDATHGVSWANIPAIEAMPGVTRQVIQGERQTLVRYVYAPGVVFPVHQHPEEQMTIVLHGRLAFTIESEDDEPDRHVALGPGEVLRIPGGARHGAEVIGMEEVESLNMLSPRRASDPVIAPREQRS
ncbi:MAG: cupin domain-containing protein [Thermomicrobiales bacterium]